MAFEYDGEQHYKPVTWSGQRVNPHESLIERQKRDSFKTEKCQENNITLIRIPYTAKRNLEKYINNKLKILGLI